jgi:hypothetical protein
MLGFTIWLAMMAAALLVFHSRRRLSGALFFLLGAWSIVLRATTTINGHTVPLIVALGMGAIWFAIGIRQFAFTRRQQA